RRRARAAPHQVQAARSRLTMVAERSGAVLRHAAPSDLEAIGALTVAGYAPIQESYVAMLGADC
ncbi:MAG: hypothetical protein ACXWYO_09785, partial [Gaiellaceae bacterium]